MRWGGRAVLFFLVAAVLFGSAAARGTGSSSPSLSRTGYGACLQACDRVHVAAVQACVTVAGDARASLRALRQMVTRPSAERNTTVSGRRALLARMTAAQQRASSVPCTITASRAVPACKVQCKH